MLTVDVVHGELHSTLHLTDGSNRTSSDAGIALFTIATVITLCRLAIRVHDGLLCWDDFWASFSIASGALMLTGVLIITHPTGMPPAERWDFDPH